MHIGTKHLAQSRAFYEAILAALGRRITSQGEDFFASDELTSMRPMTTRAGFIWHFKQKTAQLFSDFTRLASLAGGAITDYPENGIITLDTTPAFC